MANINYQYKITSQIGLGYYEEEKFFDVESAFNYMRSRLNCCDTVSIFRKKNNKWVHSNTIHKKDLVYC